MRVVIAIDSFKGCLNSKEANQAAAEGIKKVWPEAEIIQVPVSDGGEGFLDAFHAAIGGEIVEVMVNDPLMRPISAKYLLRDKEAVIEIAQACGLALLSKEERNPMMTTSYGTGQLVADAVRKGAEHIIVGLGGSATSDAGMGMLEAIQNAQCTIHNNIRFTIATDVKNPLCGENGAAHVFAPQKGANPEMVQQLDERARQFAEDSAKLFGYDRSKQEGAGAAGGLGYAFLQYLDADCKPGIQLLLEAIKFDEIVKDADLVITGEGSADRQTLMGKLPLGILQHSGNVPVCLIAGRVSDQEELKRAGFSQVECINPEGMSLEEAMRKEVAMQNIHDTISRLKRPIIMDNQQVKYALFFDIDGTLVSFKTHEIPPSTVFALTQAKANGHKVFVATGRPPLIITNLGAIEHLIDGYVTINGALCFIGDEVIRCKDIPKDVVQLVVKDALKKSYGLVVVGEKDVAVLDPNGEAEQLFRAEIDVEIVDKASPLNIVLEQRILQLTPFFSEEYERELMKRIPSCTTGRWHPAFTDITAKGADKGEGIEAMAAHLGLDFRHTIAFGDGGNDSSMIKAAGIGVAMGNALESLKEEADYTTSSVDDDGVLNALRHFGLI